MLGQKLTSKYQTTIPKEIREFLGLEAGDTVFFVRKGKDVVIQAVKHTLLDFKGVVKKPADLPDDYDEIRKIARERALKKKGLIRD